FFQAEDGIRDRNVTGVQTCALPILGLRGKEDIVELNLHEKAHGPHGLVAGTTGSGKSEIIQSYIISLAVNFHPYEVAFLLIDYRSEERRVGKEWSSRWSGETSKQRY